MKKLKYIMLITVAFSISNLVPVLTEEMHESHHATPQQASEKTHKKHDCMHKETKKCKHMCPKHIKGVTTTTRNIDNGVEITMTAKKDKTLSKLREIAREHYNPDAKESMCENCPCKVQGAVVKIEDIETGVMVLIIADASETVKKIQELAAKKHEHGKTKKECSKHKHDKSAK